MKLITLEQAKLVFEHIYGGDIPHGILFRLDRPTVKEDLWWVVAPPPNVQVHTYAKLEDGMLVYLEPTIFEYDLSISWGDNSFAWAYDIEWLIEQYEEITSLREEISSIIKPLNQFVKV